MVLAMNKKSTNDELIEKIVHLMQTDYAADAPPDAVSDRLKAILTKLAARSDFLAADNWYFRAGGPQPGQAGRTSAPVGAMTPIAAT